MSGDEIEVPDVVRRRAADAGETGAAWLANLAGLVRELAEEWELVVGRTMSGGTGSVVLETTMTDGRPAVLKLAVPGLDPKASAVRVLLAARGRAYPLVYRHNESRDAMLLERLGPQLAALSLPLDEQLSAICDTLKEAWTAQPGKQRFQTGAEKAVGLARFIEELWAEQGAPCEARTIEVARTFADARHRAFDPKTSVLAHGDAHSWNTLLAPGGGPRRFKFVDPEGLFIEPAYDLGIPMREWATELLAGDPVELGRQRCHFLAGMTGLDPAPIWQWGFLERVATGLLWGRLGGGDGAREMLAVADAWARVDGPG
ncbi:MAG: aminoglycoside phosphotransferase family protein [Caulobacterales bacterium]